MIHTTISSNEVLTNVNGDNNGEEWYVLTTNNPQHAKEHIERWNLDVEKKQEGDYLIPFIPYTFMDSCVFEKETMVQKLSIRSALFRYLFIKGYPETIADLIDGVNKSSKDKMYFLYSTPGNVATINSSDMNRLVSICSNGGYAFEIPLTKADIKVGNEIRLQDTPFDIGNVKYKIIGYTARKNHVYTVQIELTMFNVTFKRLFVDFRDVPDDANLSELVGSTQERLLGVFMRMVNNKQLEADKIKDEQLLRSLLGNKSVDFPFGAMRRHFLALMLICAQLLKDCEEKAILQKQVENELTEIGRLRESKAATDTRAYLHIAMFIATKNPVYRELAKTYVREHNPKSSFLRKWVTASSKRQALRLFGKF